MNDLELTNKIKEMVANCSFLVKRDILVEELAELLEVINSPRLYISKWSNEKVLEEFADVYLCTWQMCLYLGEDNIEQYVSNYENINDYQYKRVEWTFLQKATHAIWTVSKMRRESYSNKNVKNYTEFRAAIFLLADHLQTNMNNLKSTQCNEVIAEIRKIIEYKVERQLERIAAEKKDICEFCKEEANGSYIVEESK